MTGQIDQYPWSFGPEVLDRVREAVRLRYTAGYEALPAPIKAALLLMCGDLYENRETAVIGVSASKVPMAMAVENLLGPYRVYV